MIKIEKTEVMGFEQAIRGMRNPMNSWDKIDSYIQCREYDKLSDDKNKTYLIDDYSVGPNDHKLMMKLVKGGPVHAKFRRMIAVYVDITAPLYWWKEFDTYKVGTVANSCSTMHKIHDKEFDISDFSHEHLLESNDCDWGSVIPDSLLKTVILCLNEHRDKYIKTKNKKYWWQMIQLLPSSYNQKRTVMLNYEVLYSMYRDRKNHKLDEWIDFCDYMKDVLPHSYIFTLEKENSND